MTIRNILPILMVSFFVSCGDKNATTSENPTEQLVETITGNETAPESDTINVLLQSDDNMRFDKTEIQVPSGKTVKLTLKHTGTMPKTAMGHNFVLLKKGVDVNEFGNAAAQAKSPDFDIPAHLLNDVTAHTKMIGGGESDTIGFTAPQKGSYTFLCSFPGHYGMMKGTFIVY